VKFANGGRRLHFSAREFGFGYTCFRPLGNRSNVR
jgi:hypothetical protein